MTMTYTLSSVLLNTSSPFNNSSPVIFDVHEFYGPDRVEFQIIQSLGPYSEEISMFNLKMMDILKAQEFCAMKREGINRSFIFHYLITHQRLFVLSTLSVLKSLCVRVLC